MFEQARIEDLGDFRFGHAQNIQAGTGCTAIIAPNGACCGVNVSGGGPATRETDALRPENMVEDIHAIVLSGGSAFGLEASSGVMATLSARRIGFPLMGVHIPIVTSACLFDLGLGEIAYPDKNMGSIAAEAAFEGQVFAEGNVGAGTGASVGKILGPQFSMKTGFGYKVLRDKDLVVGAFVAVNALGNIRNPQGGWLAGCRGKEGIIDSVAAFSLAAEHQMKENTQQNGTAPSNTTIGAIVTNAKLTKAQATKISTIVNDAYARAIKPVHTSHDGDAIFTIASAAVDAVPDVVAIMATEAMEMAIYRAAFKADAAYGIPASRDYYENLAKASH